MDIRLVDKIYNKIIETDGRISRSDEMVSYILNNTSEEDKDAKLLVDCISSNNYTSVVKLLRKLLFNKGKYVITITGVNTVKSASVVIDDMSIIVGHNGEGKSTVLKCIYLAFELLNRTDINSMSTQHKNSLLSYMRDKCANTDFNSITPDYLFTYNLKYCTERLVNGIFGKLTDGWNIMLKGVNFTLNIDSTNTTLVGDVDYSELGSITYISSPQILNYISTVPSTIQSELVGLDTAGVIPTYDVDLLEKLIPNLLINNDGTKPLPIKYSDRFYIFVEGQAFVIPPNVADGTKLVSIIQSLSCNKIINSPKDILLINEPESSLHPTMLVKVIKAMSRVKCVLAISTHSPDLVFISDKYCPKYILMSSRESKFSDKSECMEHLTKDLIVEINI